MKFDIVTLFPEMFQGPLSQGVVGQALRQGLIDIDYHNPREFTADNHKTVDDRPFGGGDGMIMMGAPLEMAVMRAIAGATTSPAERNSPRRRVIYLSPQGKPLDNEMAKRLSGYDHMILICGRYGGVDQRFLSQHVDEEISVGDYILSGGELAALILIDVVSRFIPGVLGNATSADQESFANGLLESPQFTRPRDYEGLQVPEILLSGNHAKVERWRYLVSLLRTKQQRPDLLEELTIPAKDWKEAGELKSRMSLQERRACGLTDADEPSQSP